MQKTLTIATRKSPLALWQANYAKNQLEKAHPDVKVELLRVTTEGDERLGESLTKIGGKGLFVKELETALFDYRADLAVHSLKDVPMELPVGLELVFLTARDTPTDVVVCRANQIPWTCFADIPPHAHLGTSSLRRIVQLKSIRADLKFSPIRGNLGTRLRKLDNGEFDGLVLAYAGLKRLQLCERISFEIKPEEVLPACGQGILGIEIRSDDDDARNLVKVLRDDKGERAGRCERALNRYLNGGCQLPIAAYATEEGGELWLRAMVGSPNYGTLLYGEALGPISEPENLGIKVAKLLVAKGAKKLLSEVQPQ